MAIDTKHPEYVDTLPDWIVMDDTFAGERRVKDKSTEYLPATSGQIADGMNADQPGAKAYNAYRKRAHFPSIIAESVNAMLGVMHNKPPTIELPEKLSSFMESATLDGESLELLLQRINQNQLVSGRLGLLLDVQDGGEVGTLPYIATYEATSIINWDAGTRSDPGLNNLNLVVLDESEYVRGNALDWNLKRKYRALVLGDLVQNEGVEQSSLYQVGVFTEQQTTPSNANLIVPSIAGTTLDEIPFVFINSKDIVPSPDSPPLLGLGELSLTIYRGDADQRQALFMQGQDTLVVIGGTEDNYRVGANTVLAIPQGAEAKYIGVESSGLSEMRETLQNDHSMAASMGAKLLDTSSRQKESGDALTIRVAAQTATLNRIATVGAFGLERILKIAAIWVGADPDEVIVTPNLDFVNDTLEGKTIVEWMTARSLGAPISLESIHKQLQDKDLTEFEFEEEMKLIAQENEKYGLTELDDDDPADFGGE